MLDSFSTRAVQLPFWQQMFGTPKTQQPADPSNANEKSMICCHIKKDYFYCIVRTSKDSLTTIWGICVCAVCLKKISVYIGRYIGL